MYNFYLLEIMFCFDVFFITNFNFIVFLHMLRHAYLAPFLPFFEENVNNYICNINIIIHTG